MTNEMIGAIVLSFAITAVTGPFVIPFLRKLKFGQTEREEGVASHLKKAGTPTMGGVMFLLAILVTAILFLPGHPGYLPALVLTMGFGLIGFLDDYLKVVKKNSDGLLPKQKLLLQAVVTVVFLLLLIFYTRDDLTLLIPFSGGLYANIGFLAYPLLFIVVLATVNGVNFTDGLDGLASSVTVVSAAFFAAAALHLETGMEVLPCAVIGGLLGFLLFNCYPARIFMGDTGSLALGGFVAGMAYMLHMPLFILLIGLIYAVELLSVVLQVTYFKATHGKRIFKMTPIHHHFELCDWSETRIVTTFTIITILMGLLSWIAM